MPIYSDRRATIVGGGGRYAVVSESGASAYSASPEAAKEFPELEARLRGTISIARRLLDPLSEMIKAPPRRAFP
jgi:uncharacterized protein